MGSEYQIRRRILSLSFLKTCLLLVLLLIFGFYFIPYKFISDGKLITPQYSTFISGNTSIPSLISSATQDQIRCVVYITEKGGRLGNRMFIIASAYGLARLHSCHLYIVPAIIQEISSTFNANLSSILISTNTFDTINNQKNDKIRVEKNIVCEYIHQLSQPNAISKGQMFHLRGYWQSYLYFIKYVDEIRKQIFVGTTNNLQKAAQLFVEIYQKRSSIELQLVSHNHVILKQQLTDLDRIVWIGIHIRRKDFINLGFSSSDTYVLNSIKYFNERYTNAHFIIASDDKSYCQNLLKDHTNVIITPNSFSEGDDLITLSLCQHTIITGGTFGWWAGFLAGGEVLHDVIYPSGCEKREHYYPPWYLVHGYLRAHKNSNFSI